MASLSLPARAALAAAILLAVKPGFDGLMRFAGPLDFSWAYLHNLLPGTGYVFGRDVVFTYGPLAYLLTPLPMGDNLALYRLLRAGLYLHCAWSLYASYRARPCPWATAASLLALAVLFHLPRRETFDALVLASAALALHQALAMKRAVLFNLAWLLALTLLLTLAKFSYLFLLAPPLALAACLSRRELAARPAASLAAFAAVAAPAAALYAHLFGSAADLAGYARHSLAVVAGYGEAMGWGTGRDAARPLPVLALFLAVTLSFRRTAPGHFALGLAMAPMALMAWKHGYTRADPHHTLIFHSTLLVLSAVFCIGLPGPLRRAAAAVLALAMAGPLMAAHGFIQGRCAMGETLPCIRKALPDLAASWATGSLPFELAGLHAVDFERAYGPYVSQAPPPDIGDCARVSFFPFDATHLTRLGTPYFPLFVHQTYSAYTRELDRLTAEKLLEKDYGHCLVLHAGGFYPDNRLPLLDTPMLFAVLAAGYDARQDGDFVVFTRRPGAGPPRFVKIAERRALLGEEVAIPEHPGRLFATVRMSKSAAGVIMDKIHTAGEVAMVFLENDGAEKVRRVVPDVLANPFMPGYLPKTAGDYAALMQGAAPRRARAFRIVPSRPWCFKREMAVAFYAMP